MATNPDLKQLLTRLREREPGYALARRYYAGDHDLTYIGPKYRDAFGDALQEVRYNRCATIVDVHADKLQVVGFVDETHEAATDLAAVTQTIWQRNRMDRRAGEVHGEAFTLGDGYCIVWPDDAGRAVIYPQLGDRCIVRYADDGRSIALALKVWRLTSGRWRANLYYPDRVEKYLSQGASAKTIPSSGATWAPFEDEDPQWPFFYPWGVGMPVFHFGNRARTGELGISELRDVIPLQDALNKSLCNMIVTGEYASFPQRYAIGLALERDPGTGKPVNPFRHGAGELWAMGPGDADSGPASFGQFPVGDVAQFTTEQDSLDRKISNVSRVPAHWLGMASTFTSGEQLKTAETPFTTKIVDCQKAFGNVWEDAVAFSLFLEGGYELGTVSLSAQWQSAEPRSDQEFWAVAQLKLNAEIPPEQIWREAGYDESLVAEWLAAKQERDDQAAAMGAALRMAMNDQAPPEGDAGAVA